jgi:hypothetical protein
LLDLSLIQINLCGFLFRAVGRELSPTHVVRPSSDDVGRSATLIRGIVGQEPPSFYLAQDTATMKCQIVETRPVAGSRMKAIGTAHSKNERIRL